MSRHGHGPPHTRPAAARTVADSYTLLAGELDRGKFAVVKKCLEKATGREFAAKFLRKRRKGEDCRLDIINEIAVLELAARSPHVVDLHEVYETPAEIVLVLECAAGGEIFQQCVAEQDEAFTEQDVIRLVRQILRGVGFLHQHNVVHLDLKPQNILLTSSSPLGDIRIVDFGLSRRVDAVREVREILGTPEYVAPEVLSYEPISTATDMCPTSSHLGRGLVPAPLAAGVSPDASVVWEEGWTLGGSPEVAMREGGSRRGRAKDSWAESTNPLPPACRKRAKAEQCLQHPWLALAPAPAVELAAPVRADLEQAPVSEGSSGPEDEEELVLVASYTMPCPCRQLGGLEVQETELAGARKPFPALQEIAQELVF
nr:serine/threonine-protein kinase 17A-like [Chelonoidis abingdonii]